jgi:hypothetical protein
VRLAKVPCGLIEHRIPCGDHGRVGKRIGRYLRTRCSSC